MSWSLFGACMAFSRFRLLLTTFQPTSDTIWAHFDRLQHVCLGGCIWFMMVTVHIYLVILPSIRSCLGSYTLTWDHRRLREDKIHDPDHQSDADEVLEPTCFAMTCDLWRSMFLDLGNGIFCDLMRFIVYWLLRTGSRLLVPPLSTGILCDGFPRNKSLVGYHHPNLCRFWALSHKTSCTSWISTKIEHRN
jgi:hypothetical protein